ncbi:hypothetical protein TNCV_2743531 [Trichonephila clavipes]|nr:hypothetical protein TNCV_2743531 [Trichonephila clavipes]
MLDHLEDNIRRVIADIRPQMLEKVIENWTFRLDYIRASRVSPMPEIIFKIYPGISRKSPGGSLEFYGNRNDQTAVFRLLSGHLEGMAFESGRMVESGHELWKTSMRVHFWCRTFLGLKVSWISLSLSDLAAARS